MCRCCNACQKCGCRRPEPRECGCRRPEPRECGCGRPEPRECGCGRHEAREGGCGAFPGAQDTRSNQSWKGYVWYEVEVNYDGPFYTPARRPEPRRGGCDCGCN